MATKCLDLYPDSSDLSLSSIISEPNKIKVITIISDRELSLVIELKDDNKENNNDAIGLATYSNSEATILSYASIFETLWIQSELQQRAN